MTYVLKPINHFYFLNILLYLLYSATFPSVDGQTLTDIFDAGNCEAFDQQPKACQGILVGPWASVWTVPSYGLTQEYFQALLNTPLNHSIPPIDIPNSLPIDCAVQYLKMICPTYFRPCTDIGNQSNLSFSALPHFVCRSVCEEFNLICATSLLNIGGPINCSQIDPLTGLPMFPADLDNPLTEPLTCSRLENNDLGEIDFNCPPPMEFAGGNPSSFLSCDFPCSIGLNLVWNLHDYTEPINTTYAILSCISFFFTCVTLFLYMIKARFWRWPSRLIIFSGYGIFWFHLGAIGYPYYTNSELQCADEWNLQTHSWCKFSIWAQLYGAMQTACWWVVQAVLIFWVLGLNQDVKKLKRFEPFMHIMCWSYPLIAAFIVNFVPIGGVTTGGTYAGFPYCSVPYKVFGLQYGFFIGPILGFILIVSFCLTYSIYRTVIVTKQFNLKKLGNILIFGFLYLNLTSFYMAIIFWWQDHVQEFEASVFELEMCLVSTLNNLDVCTMTQQGSLFLTWYYAISLSTVGIGYSIIFISLYLKVYFKERYIIDPDRIISSRSGKTSREDLS